MYFHFYFYFNTECQGLSGGEDIEKNEVNENKKTSILKKLYKKTSLFNLQTESSLQPE